MKVVISGPQGTGKSTLLRELKQNSSLVNINFLDEVVRKLITSKGIEINKTGSVASQQAVFDQHLANVGEYTHFITDRGAIDAFVYTTWSYRHGLFTEDEYKAFEKYFLACMSHYTHLFYLPIEFEMIEDGVRNTEKEYQKELEGIYLELYEKYKLPFTFLKGSVKERVELFLHTIPVVM